MEVAAIRLQRSFRIKKLTKELTHFKFNHNIIQENSFETFTEMIQDKNLQSVINKIIGLITNITNYIGKYF